MSSTNRMSDSANLDESTDQEDRSFIGHTPSQIDALANRLAPHYTDFRIADRILLTGHSHQAWPNVARQGVLEGYHAAAERVDKKWGLAFEKIEHLRNYLRSWYNDTNGYYCPGPNTHSLVCSWLSSLNLKKGAQIVTTADEFHSISRQLKRLQEEGIEVVSVPADSLDTLADRLISALSPKTSAVLTSHVFFKTSHIFKEIGALAEVASQRGIPMLIDDYHGTNIVPFSLAPAPLAECFLVTGGYKYLQWGEGNCFLRFPKSCRLRPLMTGWFASYSSLANPPEKIIYDEGDWRFASATFDPTSAFRGSHVANFFTEQHLTPSTLRQQSLGQIGFLRNAFLNLDFPKETIDLAHPLPPEQNGGFLSLRSPHAGRLEEILFEKGVFTDSRGDILRLGPAPYIGTGQLKQAIEILGEALASTAKNL
ncbi:MAG: aminotransferase class V-fold PLP-dependent enzyme [Pirellulaceae bacterium]|nr:aminotransferase class V-fold PLP-dependent enzyme [Pirellulaceae bacterium]